MQLLKLRFFFISFMNWMARQLNRLINRSIIIKANLHRVTENILHRRKQSNNIASLEIVILDYRYIALLNKHQINSQ